jgi:HTH-type transcriptional regulator, sugar sensing transcriptional regulator
MDVTILKKLNLSDKEIKVYLNLLEYGDMSVRNLAELSELNRGTTYDILKRLQEMGLVAYYHHDTKQHFVAEDPEKLLKVISDQKEELKSAEDKIKEIIPILSSLQDKGGNKPVTKFYENKDGLRTILIDVLKSVAETEEKEYYVYSAKNASEDWKKAYPDFTDDRIRRKIKVKAISLAEGGHVSGLDERKWLGTNDISATFIMIYAGKCAFISRDSKNMPVGVIVENKMIYETQKIIFLRLWGLI